MKYAIMSPSIRPIVAAIRLFVGMLARFDSMFFEAFSLCFVMNGVSLKNINPNIIAKTTTAATY